MEIERINDHTVKFYITYRDIEERGFNREEIWYNREKSEELFWEMMDEVHHQEQFSVEGPLWIQVQALEKGLEVIVTRAQLSGDGQKLELPISEDKNIDIPVDEKIESLLDQHFNPSNKKSNQNESEEDSELDELELEDDEILSFMIGFDDFEDVIQLSHRFGDSDLINSLYHFENRYYLFVGFPDETVSEDEQDDLLSKLLEYGYESRVTIHKLEEYGKQIVEDNALVTIRNHFSLK